MYCTTLFLPLPSAGGALPFGGPSPSEGPLPSPALGFGPRGGALSPPEGASSASSRFSSEICVDMWSYIVIGNVYCRWFK